ncbi:MAG: class I SAM-dependent methyltransferase [Verrucomicrobiota bacterium JB025]|nr:class I SAM-dependent methyltransferase [Verrucomicrobiota bacterium JB025]
MEPAETGKQYDGIAEAWADRVPKAYGMKALERALVFAPEGGVALDVGCGSEGRFLRRLREYGFQTEGMDVSPRMVELAREGSPESLIHVGDVSGWEFPKRYDFISAWDSTFHLPLDRQEPALRNLCGGLAEGGVLMFTCGGGEAGEISGTFLGAELEYSTLGVERFVAILDGCGCALLHVDYDQWPEKHVVVVAMKRGR